VTLGDLVARRHAPGDRIGRRAAANTATLTVVNIA
jgi:hypothetical protein